MEKVNDKLIGFSNVIRGKNKKGNDRFQLYLTEEMAAELAELLLEKANSGTKGVKLDLHFAVRVNSHSGKEFESAFLFVKETQEQGFGAKAATAPKIAKTKVSKEDVQKKIEAFKNKSIG